MHDQLSHFIKQIVYQDNDLIIIEKPSLLLSVPGRGIEKFDSVTTRLQQLFKEIHVVHRLDWETSGLMVFARNKATQKALNIQFMNRLVDKQYLAIVYGKLQKKGMIDFPLIADWEKRPKQKVDYQKGKASTTFWQTLEVIKKENYFLSRILLTPITGRSHQLRVHLAALSHPIIGDPLYAKPIAINLASRLLLHASFLAFKHPTSQQDISFRSKCPF